MLFSTKRNTKKCTFLDKKVREISRSFVAPPCVFSLSVRARPHTVLSTNTSSLVGVDSKYVHCVPLIWSSDIWSFQQYGRFLAVLNRIGFHTTEDFGYMDKISDIWSIVMAK